jgi:hypothetical protein
MSGKPGAAIWRILHRDSSDRATQPAHNQDVGQKQLFAEMRFSNYGADLAERVNTA